MNSEHIFIIDDDKFFAKYFIMKFRLLVNSHVEFHHFTELRSVFTANLSNSPSLIFLDNELNGEIGVESIPELRDLYPSADIILVSSTECQDLAAHAKKNGAAQFISKDAIMMDKIADIMNKEMSNSRQGKLLKRLFKV